MRTLADLFTVLTALAVAHCLTGCASTTTKTYDPVTGNLIGETTTQAVDAAAFTAGANALTAIAAPRGRIVAEK
jgi:hypothetical protein